MKHIMMFEGWNFFKKKTKSFVDITKENIYSNNKTIKLRIGASKLKAIVFETDKYIISVRSIGNESAIKVFDKPKGDIIENIKIEKELFDSLWNFCIKEGFKVEKIFSDIKLKSKK